MTVKHHLLKRFLSLVLVVALLAGYVPSVQAAPTLSWKESDIVATPDLSHRKAETAAEESKYNPTDLVRVSIVLEDKSTVQAGYATMNIAQNAEAMAYSRSLQAKQETMAQTISTQALDGKKLDVVWNLTLVGNIISANVAYGRIPAIERIDGVREVVIENTYEPCVVERETVAQPQMYASIGMVGSSLVWTGGYTGAGSRIAVIDTGTDTDHQSLDNGAFLYALEQNALAKGVSYADYVAGLDLLDAQEIAAVLQNLNIYEQDSTLLVSELYLNEKLPFAVNYIDSSSRRLVVDHESDQQGEHGSHVAGIATANRYIPSGDGYADALDTVLMAGMAPDAQLITMKVFGYNGGPTDADYMAAIEDAILLGCDAVNLSLGSSVAGDSFNTVYSELLSYMTRTDTVVVASAGNSGTWADATTFGYLYSDDVGFDTVGAPGSYNNLLAVASVENDGGVGPAIKAAGSTMFYGEVTGYGNTALATLDSTAAKTGTEYDYIFIDGLGYTEDYTGMDLTGKIVFCSRGSLNFAVKANNAMALGAAAVIVYNNASGGVFGMNLSGLSYAKPCVSLSQEDAARIRSASAAQETAGGLAYYTGKMTVYGRNVGVMGNSEYYTMSSFSSWGVPGDISIKPEITAPGGSIYSLYGATPNGGGTDQYELMSGTSMAAPAVTGMVALLSQYLRESGLAEQEGMRVRTLAQSLLMSTAVPMYDELSGGNYYPVMQQGAGLARVDLAAAADTYILVDGQADGKVKAELGDDPDRTGVYEFTFSLNNLTAEEKSYAFRADLFRQDQFEYQPGSELFMLDYWTASLPGTATFTVDGKVIDRAVDLSAYDLNGDGSVNAADADFLLEYLLGNEETLQGNGDVNGDAIMNTYDAHHLLTLLSSSDCVLVPANGSVTVSVKLELSADGKALLDQLYKDGTYVEAFVYAEEVTDEEGTIGTCHSIPVLAFYGNWTDPNMYDRGTYVEMMYGISDLVPYLYQVIGNGNALTVNYGDGGEYYFGGNPYLDDEVYLPERNALNSENASALAAQYFTLIRSATGNRATITNAETGEVYYQREYGDLVPAFYFVNGGTWEEVEQRANLNWSGLDAEGNPLPEGTKVAVTITAAPEYYRNADGTHNYDQLGHGASMTTLLTIDNTAPELIDMELVDTTLTVSAKDSQYVAAVAVLNTAGTSAFAMATPNQTTPNEQITVELDLTGVMGKTFLLAVYDYAANAAVYEVTLDLPEIERPYFTVVDYNNGIYYGLNTDGTSQELASADRGLIQAAEFVDGYVFEISNGNQLYVAADDDLNNFRYLSTLDPNNELGITNFLDLAYNYADGNLYGLFYCELNAEEAPVLCTIDLYTGVMEPLYILPVDVNNMAIDGEGNFYSVGYNTTSLYTYTLADLDAGSLNYVGEVGYYYTSNFNSLAWDHNTDKLYWAYPDTLLEINPQTAEPTLLSYFTLSMVGLYIRTESDGSMFAPTEEVTHVTMDMTEARTLKDSTIALNAQVWPWNVTDTTVTWTSADESVATVDSTGLVTGHSVGRTTITATSNLDPTKSASCTLEILELDKTLNAIVWDEAGEIWWSEFNTTDLPSYTKLTAEGAPDFVATTAILNDTLYASTVETSTGYIRSKVYTVDPETFEMSLVGTSSNGYTDIAPAPHIRGGALAAVFGGYVLFVDTATGDYYYGDGDIFQMFQNNMVGITYAGSQYYNDYGFDNYLDWYFLVDSQGFVYMMGWIEGPDGNLYYLEHPSTNQGIFTVINAVSDAGYFSSLYFDGDFLYYSCFNSEKNNSTLYAIDTQGNRNAYNLGDFGDGVWPVGGLMELNTLSTTSELLNAELTLEPKAAEQTTQVSPLAVTTSKTSAVTASYGGLNAASASVIEAPALQSTGEFDSGKQEITVVVTPAADSTNGRMTVSYNSDELTLASVTGTTEAFAYRTGDGTVEIAFASADTLSADETVATLVFYILTPTEHTITVAHSESGNSASDKVEVLTVDTREYTVQWVSTSASLGGNIGMNFYAKLSPAVVSHPDAVVKFTFAGRSFTVPVSQAVKSVVNGETQYRFTCSVNAKQMTETVYAQVMIGDEPISTVLSNSVSDYGAYLLSVAPTGKLANLVKAMLNYGAAAQIHFNYKTDDLANSCLSEADRVLPDVDASAYAGVITGQEDGIEIYSVSLLLDTETIIRVYYTLADNNPEDYTFLINGQKATPVAKDGLYYVEIRGIGAHRLNEVQTFQVGGLSLRYSALSYVNVVLRYPNDSKLVDVVKALYAYSMAAEAYIG